MIHANALDIAIRAIYDTNAETIVACGSRRNGYHGYLGQCLRLKTVRVRLMDMLGVRWDEISTGRIKSSIGRIGKTATRAYSFPGGGTGQARRYGLFFEGTASGELLNGWDEWQRDSAARRTPSK